MRRLVNFPLGLAHDVLFMLQELQEAGKLKPEWEPLVNQLKTKCQSVISGCEKKHETRNKS